jgi:hypothetical protein
MEAKFSVKENKGDTMFKMLPKQEVLPNQEISWKSGRGEVHSPISGDVSHNHFSFLALSLFLESINAVIFYIVITKNETRNVVAAGLS